MWLSVCCIKLSIAYYCLLQKMTIKLMRDPKLLIKGAGVKVEHDDDLT